MLTKTIRACDATFKLIVFVIVLLTFTACANHENVLLVTKTSIGIDIEPDPATISLAYSRKEGVIAPKYKEGVLPVLATSNTEVGFVNSAAGQSMATGKASIIISRYLVSPAGPVPERYINDSEVEDMSTLTVDKKQDVKPYFFGTDTMLGVGLSFSPTTVIPGFALGYKRKEVAYAPIYKEPINGSTTTMKVRLPSLLSISQLSNNYHSVDDTSLAYEQIFATGNAATNFVKYPQIRQKIGLKFAPIPENEKAKLEEEFKEFNRNADFAAAQTQAKVKQLYGFVDSLNDANAISLEQNPPFSPATVNALVSARDPANTRASDASLSKQMLKMRIAMGGRKDNELTVWEESLEALQ